MDLCSELIPCISITAEFDWHSAGELLLYKLLKPVMLSSMCLIPALHLCTQDKLVTYYLA